MTEGSATVLIVEDDELVRLALGEGLRLDGFRVEEAPDGRAALDRLAGGGRVDLVVLDIGLPGMNGLEVLGQLRRTSTVPVIVVTARGEEPDRVLGLELGADDYVPKPVTPRELSARIRAVLRRTTRLQGASDTNAMVFDELRIDPGTREVTVDDELLDLTPKEFDLLVCLAQAPRQVLTREQLLRDVWDSSSEWQDPATVTEHVRRLRLKLEPDPADPRWLRTVRGVGYRFVP